MYNFASQSQPHEKAKQQKIFLVSEIIVINHKQGQIHKELKIENYCTLVLMQSQVYRRLKPSKGVRSLTGICRHRTSNILHFIEVHIRITSCNDPNAAFYMVELFHVMNQILSANC